MECKQKIKNLDFSMTIWGLLKLKQNKMCIFLNVTEEISIFKTSEQNVLLRAILKEMLMHNEISNTTVRALDLESAYLGLRPSCLMW